MLCKSSLHFQGVRGGGGGGGGGGGRHISDVDAERNWTLVIRKRLSHRCKAHSAREPPNEPPAATRPPCDPSNQARSEESRDGTPCSPACDRTFRPGSYPDERAPPLARGGLSPGSRVELGQTGSQGTHVAPLNSLLAVAREPPECMEVA